MIALPKLSSIEPHLICPRCGRQPGHSDPEVYVGGLVCKRCGSHWWANRLRAGDVRSQLLNDFEGDASLVDQLVNLFGLPNRIATPGFWQLMLSGQQWHRYKNEPAPGVRGRSMALLRGVVSLARRAS